MEATEETLPSERPERSDGPDPAASVKQMASAAGAAVKQEVASFASAAQAKVQDQTDEHRKTAARAIGDFATAIQHAGDELAEKDQTMAGHLIKGAADRLGDVARTLSDKRPDEMLQTLRDFGRSNPGAFAACSVLAGLAVGRLLRSSVEPPEAAADAVAGSGQVSGQLPVAQSQATPAPSVGGAGLSFSQQPSSSSLSGSGPTPDGSADNELG